MLTLRLFGDRVALLFDRRIVIGCATLSGLSLALLALSLVSGQIRVPPAEMIEVLTGGGSKRTQLIVLEWRLPRAIAALVLGALLGLGGAIFQSLTRNPLGSPDVVGFDAGAQTGAILAILLGSGSWVLLAGSAVAGGLLTALVIYLLTWQRGIRGFQLVVVGIAVAAFLSAANIWILLKAQLASAVAANNWAMGSLARVQAENLWLALWVIGPLVLAALLLARPLAIMEMGDARAASLGIAVERRRLVLMVLAISGTALVTALAGPIPFVALAAPQIARALMRSAGTTVAGAMAVGALLLLIADYAAQHAFAPLQIPVGIVTLSIGGGYLLWLILNEARR